MSYVRVVRWCLVFFLVGVAGISVLPLGFFNAYMIALAGAVFSCLARKTKGIRIAALCVCACSLGFMRAAAVVPPANLSLPHTPFPFSGTVRDEPTLRADAQTVTLATPDLLRMRLPLFPVAAEGDRISGTCTGVLPEWTQPQSGRVFPPLCIRSEGVAVSSSRIAPSRIFSAIRMQFQSVISSGISSPASDLLGGLLIGAHQSFSESLKTDFRRAGVSHVVAVSGYNISIIIAGLWCLLRRTPLGKRRSFWLLSGGVIVFVGITGAAAATVRAAVMGVLVLFGQYLGRPTAGGHALLIAATVMVAVNPFILLSSVGFQLSVLATAGLIYLSPLISVRVQSLPSLWGLKDVGVQTVSASVATAPLIAGVFHTFSFAAFPANIVIVPLIPLAMAVGFAWSVWALAITALETLTHVSLFWLSDTAALVPAGILYGIIHIARFFARVPFAQVDIAVPSVFLWAGIVAGYALIITAVFRARKRLRLAAQESRI